MDRPTLTESDFWRFRHELSRRARESSNRISEQVRKVLANDPRRPDDADSVGWSKVAHDGSQHDV